MRGAGRCVRAPSAGVALAAVILAGCTSSSKTTLDLPPSPPEISVVMREYRFEHPSQVTPGRVVFRVTNAGMIPHELTMVRLNPDQSVTAKDRVRGQPLATVVVLPVIAPGGGGIFAEDVTPGRYGFVSFTKDADGVTDLDKGMASELTVQ